MNEEELIAFVRESHNSVPDFDKYDMPLAWIEYNVVNLARLLYEDQPHWHHWTGKCIRDVPFELFVGAAGLFGVTWYYDIMLRKARDRSSPASRERMDQFRIFLENVIEKIKNEVDGTRDLESEARYKRDRIPVNRLKHIWNRILWRH